MRRAVRALRRAAIGFVVGLAPGAAAYGQIGAPIVGITLEQEGRPIDDPAVARLVATAVGAPLDMRDVRETLEHLMHLERFDDVRVFAETVDGGVRVRYLLVPQHPVDRVEFQGSLGLPEDRLRRVVSDRFGATPGAGRAAEIADVLRLEFRRAGFTEAAVGSRLIERHDPDRATLVFDIASGRRLRVSDVRFTQVDAAERSDLAERPDVRAGEPYDADAIDRALRTWEDRLRSQGYYEARGSHGDQFADDGVFVTVNLVRGPRVSLRFAGDVLPAEERERLVPIRAEGSADEDLLEDSSRAIEAALRAEGYRDAQVVFTREERDGELVITFDIGRGPRYLVRGVTLTGAAAIEATELAALVTIEEGAPLVQQSLDRSASDIERLYRSRGFTQASVESRTLVGDPVRPSDPDRLADVRIEITEGPRTLVRAVTYRGNSMLDEASLAALTALRPGQPYAQSAMVAARDRIELEYRDRGYESVTVATEVTPTDDLAQADVEVSIVEGPQSRVDHIIVVGNRRVDREVIERALVVREGAPLGYSAVIESRANLVALGLFRRVEIEPAGATGDAERDLIVRVEEAPPTILGFGGGLEGGFRLRPTGEGGQAEERFELAPRGFFQIGRRNLWGKNRVANLFTRVSLRSADSTTPGVLPEDGASGDYGFNEYRVVGTFQEPRLFDTRADGLITAIVEQAIRSSFNFSRRELRAQAAVRISRVYSVAGLYSFQRLKLFDERFTPEEKPLIDRLFPEVRLSKFTGSFIRDSRDDVLDASSGTLLLIDGDLAARALGSEVGFAKAYVQGFFYHRLPTARRMVVALGARLGAAYGFEREVGGEIVQDLPASERFFAGGDTSVRGFSLDRLGDERTITPTGFPTGGNSMVVLNGELRVGLFGGLQAVGFVDAGNVFPRAGDLDLTDLRPTAGFGVMYRSPVGPVRVDLGFNLEPREFASGARERRSVLHILLGQAF